MATNYTYPHVNVTTRALQRRTPVVTESSATTLLAPFTCDRGPENVLVAIDTMADFVSTFGELDYSNPDQRQILNIGRWIAGGGRVLACRVTDYAEEYDSNNELVAVSGIKSAKASCESTLMSGIGIEVKARYSGSYYNGMSIKFEQQNNGTYNVTVIKNNIAIERFRNKRFDEFYTIENASQYIGSILIYSINGSVKTELEELPVSVKLGQYVLSGGADTSANYLFGEKVSQPISEVTEEVDIGLADAYAIYLAKDTNGWVTLSTGDKVLIKSGELKSFYHESDEREFKIKNILWGLGKTVCQDGLNDLLTGYYTVYTDSEASFETTQVTSGGNVRFSNPSFDQFTIEYITVESVDDGSYRSFLYKNLREILKQPLETPFDVMLDCGYPIEIKKQLIKLFTEDEGDYPKRDDAFLYLTDCVIFGNGRRNRSRNDLLANMYSDIDTSSEGTNVACITHYHKVKDIYSKDSGKEVFVPTTYFLAYSIPYYDRVDGPQWPVAGQTRGVISNSLWIDHIPANKEKQEYYDEHLNYIEKDSRGMYIMSQLTNTNQDTALKFINNSRSLLKIKKELTLMARRYLHEFNDRITKTNIYNALSSYLANWIQNRTLSYGSIGLYDYTQNEALTNEELLITLDIKFTGTIEVLSFEITVE